MHKNGTSVAAPVEESEVPTKTLKDLTESNRKNIIELYKKGVKTRIIARIIGCHPTSVSHIANEAGFRRQKLSPRRRTTIPAEATDKNTESITIGCVEFPRDITPNSCAQLFSHVSEFEGYLKDFGLCLKAIVIEKAASDG